MSDKMTDNNSTDGFDERDMRAAEYALALLGDAERLEAERLVEEDHEFARRVESWQLHLDDLNRRYRSVAPPSNLRQAIERRLFGDDLGMMASDERGWRGRLAFLGGAVLGAVTTAAIGLFLYAFVSLPTGSSLPIRSVASLQPPEGAISYVALVEPDEGRIVLRHISGDLDSAGDYELWLIGPDGQPVSLGLVERAERTAVPIRVPMESGNFQLAISQEPAGGSPTGSPTGPVVSAGALQAL